MPANRNALIRYKTIDQCLQNRFRSWTLEDLIEACSEALYEYEGIDKGVSKRTIQLDLQFMRSDKLGYNAPIVVEDKKFYTYEDPDYSITNIPLTDQDLGKLTEVVEILRQFQGFTHFSELSGIVQKLEDKIQTTKTNSRPIIDFEKNTLLKGLAHVDSIYHCIKRKEIIELEYKSFKARSSSRFEFHPMLLKEFRNRWFILGQKGFSDEFQLLALDRIMDLYPSKKSCKPYSEEKVSRYFNHVIGVTVNNEKDKTPVVLWLSRRHAPYVLTKPMHHSQVMIEQDRHGVTIQLEVIPNYELEKEILSFGEDVRVLSPRNLQRRIKSRLQDSIDGYETSIKSSSLKNLDERMDATGSAHLFHIYTKRSVYKIKRSIWNYFKKSKKENYQPGLRNLFDEIPSLKNELFNSNLLQVVEALNPKMKLTKASLMVKNKKQNWSVTWHQDKVINVKEKIECEGFSGWTKKGDAFGVVPPLGILDKTIAIRIHLDDTDVSNGALEIIKGSHKKVLDQEEVHTIVSNALPSIIEVPAGGIHIMKPLVLHRSSKAWSQKQRSVIHLEFCAETLPEKLEWAMSDELS